MELQKKSKKLTSSVSYKGQRGKYKGKLIQNVRVIQFQRENGGKYFSPHILGRSKVEKKLNLDDSYDVVIESITYV